MESYRLAFDVPEPMQNAFLEIGLDLGAANPNVPWRLPIPATYIVATDHTIRARFINADYTSRMEPADVLDAARAAAN